MGIMRLPVLNEIAWQEFQLGLARRQRLAHRPTRVEALNQELTRLKKLWKQVQGTRRRDAIYRYLSQVFELVRSWQERGRRTRLVRYVQDFAGTEINRKAEAYRTVIQATASVDGKMASKLSRVLRYCDVAKPDNDRLKAFIKRGGGLNACASRFTRDLGQPRPHRKSRKASD
jgi:hypothetical protein